jgi:hypothetical protein
MITLPRRSRILARSHVFPRGHHKFAVPDMDGLKGRRLFNSSLGIIQPYETLLDLIHGSDTCRSSMTARE